MKFNVLPSLRITILLLALFCFAVSAQAAPTVQMAQVIPGEVMPIGVSFYQQQLDKLNYSLREDGSFKISGESVRPSLARPQKPEDAAGDRSSSRTKPAQSRSTTPRPTGIREPQPSRSSLSTRLRQRSAVERFNVERTAETVGKTEDKAKVSPSQKILDQTTDQTVDRATTKTKKRRQVFARLRLPQQKRKDPYIIMAEARAKHSPLQTATFPSTAILSEKTNQLSPSGVKNSIQQHVATLQKNSQLAVNENFGKLKAQLESRFLIEGLSLSDLPTSLAAQVKDHTDRTKATLKEKTRSLLKHVENGASRAAEALR